VKNLAEVQKFIVDSISVGSQIAKDHGASEVELLLGIYVDDLPPSIASGVGQLTEALMVVNRVRFSPKQTPVRRTRKFTIFHPTEGKEIYPGANMDVSDSSCLFHLHVGNAMNPGWGVFADWRNNNLSRIISQLESYLGSAQKSELQKHSSLSISKFEYSGL
jgi:hypothetical protein